MLNKCNVVAEIGCSHLGQMDRAKELITLARFCGADYAKFQKRCPEESTPEEMKNQPHPNQIYSYGATYLEHRKALELSIEQHYELKAFCEQLGKIKYSCSVWDMTSAKEVVDINPDYIKIGSPCNQNFEMIDYLVNHYSGQIHISFGMVSKEERSEIINYFVKHNMGSRLVVYHCTSEYPCPFERLYLREIVNLQLEIPSEISVGFSNHGYGIAMDIAAVSLGAEWLERHFVDDRTLRHTDAAVSLEPNGLRAICRDVKALNKAMTSKPEGMLGMSDDELSQRRKLKGK